MTLRRSNLKTGIDPLEIQRILSEYDHVDWKTEPTESWKDLLKQRAQQLRDSYDHIVLHFSGGSDSTTVLNAFTENNIHLDEIITVSYNIDAACLDGKKAADDINQRNLSNVYRQILIQPKQIYDYISNDTYLSEGPNFSGNLHAFARFNINELETYGFAEPRARKGKVCYLFGEQDPDVIVRDGIYFVRFTLKNYFTSSMSKTNTGFFTTPNFPQLHVKQCHLVAQYMKNSGINFENRQAGVQNWFTRKNVVRDFYSSQISPIKTGGFAEYMLDKTYDYSEAALTLKYFIKDNPEYKSLYINKILPVSVEETRKIMTLNDAIYRIYQLT